MYYVVRVCVYIYIYSALEYLKSLISKPPTATSDKHWCHLLQPLQQIVPKAFRESRHCIRDTPGQL